MNRLQYFVAQIGHREKKDVSVAMLLEHGDLPGNDWELLDQRSWRTGAMPIPIDEAARAHHAGSWTAWRSFQQSGQTRWAWIEIMPFTSNTDALSAVSSIPTWLMSNAGAKVAIVEERNPDESETGATHLWVLEQRTIGSDGPSATRYVADVVDNVLFIVAGTASGDGWDWSAVSALAERQAAKIRSALDDPVSRP